ncbi:MAG: GNAT family N-acetyltransferase, partial [Acidobacteriota bacterium]
DAEDVERLAGAREVALNTLMIPHPYPAGEAIQWIATQDGSSNRAHTFAITRRSDGALLGAIGLMLTPEHDRGELGYWIGVPYWGNGYLTEAARAIVGYGFESLGVNRIFAACFARNAASMRVLQKIGMRHEGTQRQHLRKWEEYVDAEMYGMLRSDWQHPADAR